MEVEGLYSALSLCVNACKDKMYVRSPLVPRSVGSQGTVYWDLGWWVWNPFFPICLPILFVRFSALKTTLLKTIHHISSFTCRWFRNRSSRGYMLAPNEHCHNYYCILLRLGNKYLPNIYCARRSLGRLINLIFEIELLGVLFLLVCLNGLEFEVILFSMGFRDVKFNLKSILWGSFIYHTGLCAVYFPKMLLLLGK